MTTTPYVIQTVRIFKYIRENEVVSYFGEDGMKQAMGCLERMTSFRQYLVAAYPTFSLIIRNK